MPLPVHPVGDLVDRSPSGRRSIAISWLCFKVHPPLILAAVGGRAAGAEFSPPAHAISAPCEGVGHGAVAPSLSRDAVGAIRSAVAASVGNMPQRAIPEDLAGVEALLTRREHLAPSSAAPLTGR
jgi:hypothetical protein